MDAARYINRNAPWAYYAYGLLLSKNKQSTEALAQFEVAAEQSLKHRIPLFAPLREVIRHRTLNNDFAPAVRDSLRLTQAVMDFADAGELGNDTAATLASNVDFVGRIMGFVKGPALDRARTTVDVAAWESHLKSILPSDQWVIYTEAGEEVLKQYADQLALKEEREKEFQDRVQEMRDSGETRSVQFASKVQGNRSRDRTHSRTSTPLTKVPGEENRNPQQQGQFNSQQNGVGSQQSTTIQQNNSETPSIWMNIVRKNKRTVDWSKDYESTKHLDPSQPQIREPYILRTYLPEDFELRRLVFLTDLTQAPSEPQS